MSTAEQNRALRAAQSMSAKGYPFPGGKILQYDPIGGEFKVASMSGQQNPIAAEFTATAPPNINRSSLGERYWGENLLGQPVFMPVKLGGMDLPNPLISISGRVTLVETPLVGQEGTVKEEICVNDYDINLKLFVFDDSGIYPEDLVGQLRDLWKSRRLLTIESVLTDFFLQAKDNCIITGISAPEQVAAEDMQIIEFSLRSDREYELILD